MNLYHGTSAENIPYICKLGILTSTDQGRESIYPETNPDYVYAVSKEYGAISWGKIAVRHNRDEEVYDDEESYGVQLGDVAIFRFKRKDLPIDCKVVKDRVLEDMLVPDSYKISCSITPNILEYRRANSKTYVGCVHGSD